MRTNELSGTALDWAVAKCEGRDIVLLDGEIVWRDEMRYSTDWALGGEIIERERIGLTPMPDGSWKSQGQNLRPHFHNPTALVAAMRCYVASKLGDNVELPGELK